MYRPPWHLLVTRVRRQQRPPQVQPKLTTRPSDHDRSSPPLPLCQLQLTRQLHRPRSTPSTPDTPLGLHRYLPRILFPFDRAGTGDEWLAQTARVREAYLDASTIDWSYEESRERVRVHELAELKGLR